MSFRINNKKLIAISGSYLNRFLFGNIVFSIHIILLWFLLVFMFEQHTIDIKEIFTLFVFLVIIFFLIDLIIYLIVFLLRGVDFSILSVDGNNNLYLNDMPFDKSNVKRVNYQDIGGRRYSFVYCEIILKKEIEYKKNKKSNRIYIMDKFNYRYLFFGLFVNILFESPFSKLKKVLLTKKIQIAK